VKLGWKSLRVTNTLTYYGSLLITEKKRFITLGQGLQLSNVSNLRIRLLRCRMFSSLFNLVFKRQILFKSFVKPCGHERNFLVAKFQFRLCLYRFVLPSFVHFRSSQMFTGLCLQSNKAYHAIKPNLSINRCNY